MITKEQYELAKLEENSLSEVLKYNLTKDTEDHLRSKLHDTRVVLQAYEAQEKSKVVMKIPIKINVDKIDIKKVNSLNENTRKIFFCDGGIVTQKPSKKISEQIQNILPTLSEKIYTVDGSRIDSIYIEFEVTKQFIDEYVQKCSTISSTVESVFGGFYTYIYDFLGIKESDILE